MVLSLRIYGKCWVLMRLETAPTGTVEYVSCASPGRHKYLASGPLNYRLGISIALTIRSFDLSAQLIDRDSMEFITRRKFEFLLHAVHANLSRILAFASTNTEAANIPR